MSLTFQFGGNNAFQGGNSRFQTVAPVQQPQAITPAALAATNNTAVSQQIAVQPTYAPLGLGRGSGIVAAKLNLLA